MAKNIVVDVESDGPCPGMYSMVSFGAAFNVDGEIKSYYSGIIKPLLLAQCDLNALAVSGISREEQLNGQWALPVMNDFVSFLKENDDGTGWIFWSDNPCFDWQFMNYYFYMFTESNPFGFSGRRIGDLYAGAVKDIRPASKWKKYRVTKHTHNPEDDAIGNLEALNTIRSKYF